MRESAVLNALTATRIEEVYDGTSRNRIMIRNSMHNELVVVYIFYMMLLELYMSFFIFLFYRIHKNNIFI